MRINSGHVARCLAVYCAALLLAACEGLHTGDAVYHAPLEPDGNGGFKPHAFSLKTEMFPVALNFHAELGIHPDEAGKWNRYRATVTRAGQTVALNEFNVNYTVTPEMPAVPPTHSLTMLVLRSGEGGEYVLGIEPVKAPEVSLNNPRLEIRRNVQTTKPLD